MSFKGYCRECGLLTWISGRVPVCESCDKSRMRARRIGTVEKALSLPEGEDMIERSPEDLEADDV